MTSKKAMWIAAALGSALAMAPPAVAHAAGRSAALSVARKVGPHHRRQQHSARVARMMLTAQRRLSAPCTGSGCRTHSPYRLAGDSISGPDMKARALADTGTRCALIGETICQSKTHAILRSGETPLETIGGNLPQ